jgi:hypothetical protein
VQRSEWQRWVRSEHEQALAQWTESRQPKRRWSSGRKLRIGSATTVSCTCGGG